MLSKKVKQNRRMTHPKRNSVLKATFKQEQNGYGILCWYSLCACKMPHFFYQTTFSELSATVITHL